MRIFKFVLEEEIDGVVHRMEQIIDVPALLSKYSRVSERGSIIVNVLWDMDRKLTEQISSGQSSDDAEKNKQT